MSTQAPLAAYKMKTPPRTMTGAEAVVACLLEEGVDTIFGYPGGAIMPVYDAFYDYQDRLKHILVRHEQGAVHAAQGYARVSNRVGVCIATSGPGATNLITGIADAQIDSTPLVCITGQVGSHLLGTDAFQETDVIGISMPVTKWNYQITKAEDIPAAFAKAFYIAKSGRPGPVLLDITKDAQFNKLDFKYEPCTGIRSYAPYPKSRPDDIIAAASLINSAKKPYILVGHGVLISQAQEEFKAFVEKTGIPVASTLMGLSAFPCDHPLYVGYLGMHGNYGPNVKTNQADVIIAVGMRFDDRVTGNLAHYAKQAKVIHIEIDPAEIGKIIQPEVAINADAKEALLALMPHVQQRSHSAWIQEFRDCDTIEHEKVISREFTLPENSIKMANVVERISRKTSGEAIVVTDVGQHQMVVSRYYAFRGQDNNVTSGGLGTMGFALPAAIGAKFARPNDEVIAVIGDGGFQMTLQELGTIFQEETGVKIVLLNNNFLGMVRQWQQLFFDRRYSFVELKNPNFIKIAEGFGITARKIEHPSDLDGALDEMLAHKGPYFLEVVVEKEENVFPMVPTGASVADIRLE